MFVEQKLCRKLVDIFTQVLPGVEIEGNWLPSEDGGFKGEDEISGSSLRVRVSSRGFESFTSAVCTFRVELEGRFRVEDDTDGHGTFVCCSKLLDALTGWQGNITTVKRDLCFPEFDPVGYRLDPNGDLDIERDTLTRNYTLSFTLKGRITR